jgi:hypothetical protein
MGQPRKLKVIASEVAEDLPAPFAEETSSQLDVKYIDIFASMRSEASVCNSRLQSFLAPGNWSGGGLMPNEAATTSYTSCPELIFPDALEEELAIEEGRHAAQRCKTSRALPQQPPASLLDALRSHRVSPCAQTDRVSSADSRNRSSQKASGRSTYMFGPRLADSRSLHLIMSSNSRQGRQRNTVRPVASASRISSPPY